MNVETLGMILSNRLEHVILSVWAQPLGRDNLCASIFFLIIIIIAHPINRRLCIMVF